VRLVRVPRVAQGRSFGCSLAQAFVFQLGDKTGRIGVVCNVFELVPKPLGGFVGVVNPEVLFNERPNVWGSCPALRAISIRRVRGWRLLSVSVRRWLTLHDTLLIGFRPAQGFGCFFKSAVCSGFLLQRSPSGFNDLIALDPLFLAINDDGLQPVVYGLAGLRLLLLLLLLILA
jgi:hypothetical protein